MSRSWIVRWTTIMSASFALIVWPVAFKAGPWLPLVIVGFLGFFVSGLVLADKPTPWSRYLPAVLTIPIVGALPLYRFLAVGDSRSGGVFLGMTAFLYAVLLVGAAYQLVRQRGWVVDTNFRRKAIVPAMFAALALQLAGKRWPASRADLLIWAVIAFQFGLMFWPTRFTLRRPVLPPPSPHRPA